MDEYIYFYSWQPTKKHIHTELEQLSFKIEFSNEKNEFDPIFHPMDFFYLNIEN